MKVDSPIKELLFTTVRITTDDGISSGAGTGFIYKHDVDGRSHHFVVTNKHVVLGSKETWIHLTIEEDAGPQFGSSVDVGLQNDESNWFGHPSDDVDVTVRYFSGHLAELNRAKTLPFIRAISKEVLPSEQEVEDFEAAERVLFVGYPIGLYDKANLTPIIRQGITATPLQLDYGDAPIFLIDGSVFPGSSGSPVVMADLGAYSSKGGLVVGSRLFFLGVVAAVMRTKTEGSLDLVEIPTQVKAQVWTHEMIDLGVVFKARTVVETIEAWFRSLPSDST